MIQVIDVLDHLNIPYKTSGKNVSGGWVEISCPTCDDRSFHCGVNLASGYCNCWVCGHKSHLVPVLMKSTNLPYPEISKIVKEFSEDTFLQEEEVIRPESTLIPKEATKELPQLHLDYLRGRNFDPIQIQKDYRIMACNTIGYFSYRIIIPIFLDGKIICFTGRDVTGRQEDKYKNCPNSMAQMEMKSCIYNIDTVKDRMIICEGPTDVWRIGKGSVATMGVEYTTTQLALLAQKEAKEIFILYDSDAITKAEKLAAAVSTFCPKVEILELENGDPGDMNQEDVIELRKEIGI